MDLLKMFIFAWHPVSHIAMHYTYSRNECMHHHITRWAVEKRRLSNKFKFPSTLRRFILPLNVNFIATFPFLCSCVRWSDECVATNSYTVCVHITHHMWTQKMNAKKCRKSAACAVSTYYRELSVLILG